jgi:predicted DNA-binding transcriptional regulator AlpA
MEIVSNAQHTAKRVQPHKSQPVAVAQNPDALLTIPTSAALMGSGVSTVYALAAKDPTFPKLIKRGARCTRIRAGDLTAWLKAQAAL